MEGYPNAAPRKPDSVARANLEQRLAELARTRDAGLITEEEFKRKRKEMVDKF
jgi:cytochrome c-type biogenesis protein CcmH/NrfG